MRPDLLAWQWANYLKNHRDRQNLMVHALTVPIFHAGTLAIVMSTFTSWTLAIVGISFCGFAMSAQGRGHGRESEKPIPFEGPLDVVTRIFAEQWVTFPRYMISGEFVKAWRDSQNSPR